MNKSLKNFMFYIASILLYILLFNLSYESNILEKIIIIFLSIIISFYCIIKTKKYFEEIIIFFMFPIIFSEIIYNIIIIFYNISNTISVLLYIIMIPLANFLYSYISVKRKELSIIELSQLVTFVRCILFISTIIGFVLKNPLFLDGFLRDIDVEFIELNLKLNLTDYINIIVQSMCIPYLISATFIKGFIELKNLKATYKSNP